MKLRSVMLVLLLLSPSAAFAGPITTATAVWSQVTGVNGDGTPFWDGASWDNPSCGAGCQLAINPGLDGLEYLNNGAGGYTPFRFDDPTISTTLIYNVTSWLGGVLGGDSTGAFTYDNGTGQPLSNSWTTPQQYALFRVVGTEFTTYFMGIEDILMSAGVANDLDYNDYGVAFRLPTTPVPEPSTLLLMGMSIVGLGAWKRRAANLQWVAANQVVGLR